MKKNHNINIGFAFLFLLTLLLSPSLTTKAAQTPEILSPQETIRTYLPFVSRVTLPTAI